MADTNNDALLALTGDVVTSFLLNNKVSADDLPSLIQTTYDALGRAQAGRPEEAPAEEYVGAVSVKKSLAHPDKIISMIDGKPYSMLTRHLTGHGLTPADYRQRYKLPSDYPMTAPAYSQKRRTLAVEFGLGRKAGQAVKQVADAVVGALKPARQSGEKTPESGKGGKGRTLSLGSALKRAKERVSGDANEKGNG